MIAATLNGRQMNKFQFSDKPFGFFYGSYYTIKTQLMKYLMSNQDFWLYECHYWKKTTRII